MKSIKIATLILIFALFIGCVHKHPTPAEGCPGKSGEAHKACTHGDGKCGHTGCECKGGCSHDKSSGDHKMDGHDSGHGCGCKH